MSTVRGKQMLCGVLDRYGPSEYDGSPTLTIRRPAGSMWVAVPWEIRWHRRYLTWRNHPGHQDRALVPVRGRYPAGWQRPTQIPATTSIPIELNVDLFPRSDAPEVPENPYDLYSSKEVGEPPLVLAAIAFFAIKHAILAARQDRGHDEWFALDAPATVQRIHEACLVTEDDLTLAAERSK